MEIAYLHLITNHIPIIGVPFALALLIFGFWRKSSELKALAYLTFALLGIATLVVYFLGQGGEDFIEELPGVSHDAIEDHEDFAMFPLVTMIVTAVISLFALIRYGGVGLLLKRNTADSSISFPGWLSILVLVFGLVSAGLLGYTGRLGGAIRHPEFHGKVNVPSEGPDNKTKSAEDESDGKGRGRNRGGR